MTPAPHGHEPGGDRMGAFTTEQRRTLEQLAAGTGPMACPVCGATLVVNDVPGGHRISYVRHRVWVICPSCRRSAAVDVRIDR